MEETVLQWNTFSKNPQVATVLVNVKLYRLGKRNVEGQYESC